MGRTIVKQPNGKLAVWSSIVDDFIMMDADWDDYIALQVEEATRSALRTARSAQERVEATGSSSRMGTTWEDLLERVKLHHGEEQAQLRRTLGEVGGGR